MPCRTRKRPTTAERWAPCESYRKTRGGPTHDSQARSSAPVSSSAVTANCVSNGQNTQKEDAWSTIASIKRL
eukprot:7993575-Alexandrium_andersonii.AAC.1